MQPTKSRVPLADHQAPGGRQSNSVSCDLDLNFLDHHQGTRMRRVAETAAPRPRASRSNRSTSSLLADSYNNISLISSQQNNNTSHSRKTPTISMTMSRAARIPWILLLITKLTLLMLVSMFLSTSSVFQAQAIKLQPEGKEKFYWSGEQFVITCQNNNNIKNVKIRWIGPNGHDITDDKSQRVHAESTGPHGSRLVVMNATAPNDDGQYKCTLGSTDDRNPREHIEFELKLYKTTSFKDTVRKMVLPAGTSGTLSCRVEFDAGVVTPTVEWVRDNIPIDMHNDTSFKQIEYDPSSQLSQLIISPVTKQHDGIYTCRAVAVTTQLSKISDHNIQLEIHYAPSFERDSEIVWVERAQSTATGAGRQNQVASQQHGTAYSTGARPSGNHARNRYKQQHHAGGSRGRTVDSEWSNDQEANAHNSTGLVRVELKCTCQANPQASILWTSSHSENYVLAKGSLPHILEEPRVEADGPNSTSVLVINYSLDPNWEHRRDTYTCSASNKLGKAAKRFSVEQGDPPPAFNVAPLKSYDPQSSQFRFTLLGPNYDPDLANSLSGSSARGQPQDIRPPVDSFRIRAEIPSSGSGNPSDNRQQVSYLSNSRRHNEPNVQWNLMTGDHQDQVSRLHLQNHELSQYAPLQLGAPRNFTINLGRLPSGNQKLFLEAHNAVGWSPNATYLGEYYIVSGANSIMSIHLSSVVLLILASLSFSLMTMHQQQPRSTQ